MVRGDMPELSAGPAANHRHAASLDQRSVERPEKQ